MEKDISNRKMGLKKHKCRICGVEGFFQSYLVREMMKETRDEFEYFECANCHCLQISEVPDNLGYYYGDEYFSMIGQGDSEAIFEKPVTDSTKILDVGCGIGVWLYEMAEQGHDNLYGCDPFLDKDVDYGDRVHIKKADITELDGEGSFDVIRMWNSFEHVTNPAEVLEKAMHLLKNDGYIWMAIPIYPNIAFDMFETHWYQLDAPRHIFLYSIKSIKFLADKCRLSISKIEFNSDPRQIIVSFFYQHNVFYNRINRELVEEYFSDDDIGRMLDLCEEANKNKRGDHAVVWFKKIQEDTI